jgi:hypothetical protein
MPAFMARQAAARAARGEDEALRGGAHGGFRQILLADCHPRLEGGESGLAERGDAFLVALAADDQHAGARRGQGGERQVAAFAGAKTGAIEEFDEADVAQVGWFRSLRGGDQARDLFAREHVRRGALQRWAIEARGRVVLAFVVADLEAEEAAQGGEAARDGGGRHLALVQVANEGGIREERLARRKVEASSRSRR